MNEPRGGDGWQPKKKAEAHHSAVEASISRGGGSRAGGRIVILAHWALALVIMGGQTAQWKEG
jgi:hypothetical protein